MTPRDLVGKVVATVSTDERGTLFSDVIETITFTDGTSARFRCSDDYDADVICQVKL